MKTVVITGGIATGKTTALNYLRSVAPDLVFFDSDAATSSLLDSGDLSQLLVESFGSTSVLPDGKANRPFLRDLIFHNPTAKKTLESLLHPKILQECLALQQDTVKNKPASAFIADVPLFFESDFEIGQYLVVVISLTGESQWERLSRRNKFSPDLVTAIINSQAPLSEKEKKSDVVLWNEGPIEWLYTQIDLFYHHYLI